jgi:methionyl-tRNA formyltransferase
MNEREHKVWRAEKIEFNGCNIEPGKVISTVGGPVVKCGEDAIRLTSMESTIELVEGMYL